MERSLPRIVLREATSPQGLMSLFLSIKVSGEGFITHGPVSSKIWEFA
jgi:hypothetical protein